MRRRSFWALKLSIQHLMSSEAQLQLFGRQAVMVPASSAGRNVYLWTFTFADEVEEREAAVRWNRFADYLRRSGKSCVRVLERGGVKGRLHYHAVTRERWEVREVRPKAEGAGFGRIHVKLIPAEKAGYVAKYLGKYVNRRAKIRLWACVGFKGATVSSVRISNRVVASDLGAYGGFCDSMRWKFADVLTVENFRRAPVDTLARRIIREMELKKTQVTEILTDVANGHVIFVGEYRGHQVRSFEVADKRTGAKQRRCVVDHNVEVTGLPRVVTEWLPPGSDASAARPAANKGDVVKVLVETMTKFSGQTSYGGTIKALSQLV